MSMDMIGGIMEALGSTMNQFGSYKLSEDVAERKRIDDENAYKRKSLMSLGVNPDTMEQDPKYIEAVRNYSDAKGSAGGSGNIFELIAEAMRGNVRRSSRDLESATQRVEVADENGTIFYQDKAGNIYSTPTGGTPIQ